MDMLKGGIECIHGRNGIGKKNAEERMLLKLCDKIEIRGFEKSGRRIRFKFGNNESKIHFVEVNKENRKYLKAIKIAIAYWKFSEKLKIYKNPTTDCFPLLGSSGGVETYFNMPLWKLGKQCTSERYNSNSMEIATSIAGCRCGIVDKRKLSEVIKKESKVKRMF